MEFPGVYIQEIGAVSIKSSPLCTALDFLNRVTTQEFKAQKTGEIAHGALVDASARLITLFVAEIRSNEILLWTNSSHTKALVDALEALHFAEDLQINMSTDVREQDPMGTTERVNSGLIQEGVDFKDMTLILELPLSPYLSRTKGCYPGQEVVERVFTYGSPAKKLVQILVNENSEIITPGSLITASGKSVGTITSVGVGKAFGIIQRPHYKVGHKVDQGIVQGFSQDFTLDF